MKSIAKYLKESKGAMNASYIEVIKYLQSIKNDPVQSSWIFIPETSLVGFCEYMHGYTGAPIESIQEGFEGDIEELEEIFNSVESIFMVRTKKFEQTYNVVPLCTWTDLENNGEIWHLYGVVK